MKLKVVYTDGNIMKGLLDGVSTDIKVLGNIDDKYLVDIAGSLYTIKISYTKGINEFDVDSKDAYVPLVPPDPIEPDEDEGSSSDDSGSSSDDEGSSSDDSGSSSDDEGSSAET